MSYCLTASEFKGVASSKVVANSKPGMLSFPTDIAVKATAGYTFKFKLIKH